VFFTPWREVVHSGNINTFTYTKQEVDSKITNVSEIQVFRHPYVSGDTRSFKLGRLNLQNDGHQAIITVNACYGWNLNNEGFINESS